MGGGNRVECRKGAVLRIIRACRRSRDRDDRECRVLVAGDRLLERVRNLTVRVMPSGTLFPAELTQYDPWVLREALHNAIAHQDYRRQARIVAVEFPDRVIVNNAGEFLPGSVMTVIEQDAPPFLYRNPFLVDAMVELNLIDTQGGGRRHQAHVRNPATALLSPP